MPTTATPCPVPAAARCDQLLPGHGFVDAYCIDTPAPLDAPTATQVVFANAPLWVRGLMELRNQLVGRLGLKAAPASGFPVLSSTPSHVCLGLDDRHLDFRIAVTSEPRGAGSHITVTTAVRCHNVWGHRYLWLVMPFHRRIAQRMLQGAVRG